jgi:hypothetical protein
MALKALTNHKMQNDFLGRTMRNYGNLAFVNLVFDGYRNGNCDSYTRKEGFVRYVKLEKEPFVIFIECIGRNCYRTYIYNWDGPQLLFSHQTNLKKLKELLDVLKQPCNILESYVLNLMREV